MRIIEIKAYQFDELSDEAKEKAIESVRNSYYEYNESNHNEFASWAIDDSALFEPPHKELDEMFGVDYKFPLIENTRKKIYFSADREWYLDCENAMVITNNSQFLKWLGIPDEIAGEIVYNIFTPSGRNSSTTIDFSKYPFDSDYDSAVMDAIDKFNGHIQACLIRIEKEIDCRYSDEAIIEDISANGYEFTEDGQII